ncbi:hypothetical protein [Caballeronia sp. AZ1_KS37]|uniref:hypothetical protein n=1 Tax=Caballeronia sp. AZ1_KS37 TaxID=2921756 RepID=UPI0020279010|nr:hypothetical protein [Caballeronia sp. AZ1_KS37]
MRITTTTNYVRVPAVISAGDIINARFRNGRSRYTNSLAVPKQGFKHWQDTDFGRAIIEFAETNDVDVFDPQTIFPVKDGDETNEAFGFNPLHEGAWVISCSSLSAPRIFRDDKLFSVESLPNGIPLLASLQLSTDDSASRVYARLTSVNIKSVELQ